MSVAVQLMGVRHQLPQQLTADDTQRAADKHLGVQHLQAATLGKNVLEILVILPNFHLQLC